MSDFMNDKDGAEEATDKITIGDQEFGQKELQELVELGRIGKEAEEKFNTPIGKVYPEFTKTTQKVKEQQAQLEASATELAELKAQMASQKSVATGGYTPEQKEQIRKEFADVMGGVPMTEAQFDEKYEARKTRDDNVKAILSDVDNLMADIKANGQPEVDKSELLEYMKVNDFRRASSAYKEMKDAELDTWKMDKISGAKRPGLHTVTTSQPGGKEPPKVPITLDNLQALTREALGQN